MSAVVSADGRCWRTAARVASAIEGFDETEGHAVWFTRDRERSSFVVVSGDVLVDVPAGVGPGADVSVALSPRLVWFVAGQSVAGVVSAVRIIDDGTALFDGGGLQAAIDLVADARLPQLPWDQAPAATATIDVAPLLTVLNAGRIAPPGVDLCESPVPPLWVGIDVNGLVSVHTDWRERAAGRSTLRATAVRAAGAAVRAPHVRALPQLLEALQDDDVHRVVLGLPAAHDGWATVGCEVAQVWLRCTDATVGRWRRLLLAALDEADLPRTVVDDRTVVFGPPQRRARIELLGGATETLRISVVVAEHIPSTVDVLGELNQANAGLIGVRLWLDGHRVVAAVDLPCDQIDDVLECTAGLWRQLDSFGAFLGSLAGSR